MIAKAKKKLIPAVAYVRMSTDMQSDSPRQQRSEIKKMAKREGYSILRWYEDKGISGDEIEKRPQFCEMLTDASELGDFRAILCWDQDRFGRFDSLRAGVVIEPLRRADVCLVTMAQGVIDWNDFAGRMMYAIQQEGKHQFLRDLSRNVVRGMIEQANKGVLFHHAPYGYDKVFYDEKDKLVHRVRFGVGFAKPKDWVAKLEISEDKQAVDNVRWVFKTFAETDRSLLSIADELNASGRRTTTGKFWRTSTVRRILVHPVYCGDYIYGRQRIAKYYEIDDHGELAKADLSKRRKRREAPIVIHDSLPAIVDRKTFNLCQQKLSERQNLKCGPTKRSMALSGILVCGYCGIRMVRSVNPRPNKRYIYYRCSTNSASGPSVCPGINVRAERIEQYLFDHFRRLAESGDLKMETVQRSRPQRKKTKDPNIDSLLSRISRLDKQIDKGTENLLLADEDIFSVASAKLREWRREQDELRSELEALESVAQAHTKDSVGSQDEVIKIVMKMTDEDPTIARQAVKSLVSSITLWFGKPLKNQTRTLSKGEILYRSNVTVMAHIPTIMAGSMSASFPIVGGGR